MYDPKSSKAVEFISHEEILASIEFAEKNKQNRPLIEEILEKAKNCKGIPHREALTLLLCDDRELNDRMFA